MRVLKYTIKLCMLPMLLAAKTFDVCVRTCAASMHQASGTAKRGVNDGV